LDASATAIVVLSCQRPEYLDQTLRSLLSLEGIGRFTVIISQDGSHAGVEQLAQATASKHPNVRHVHNSMRQDHRAKKEQAAVHYIADHYKFVLTHVFEHERYTHAILVEEDMVVSRDFLQLFINTAPLLDQDPTLMCVSSWNDNGYKHLDLDPTRLFRTGFFPGLGWMLKKELWLEVKATWPASHWDHWMRCDSQSKGRDCIAPEVSRTHNIGVEGATVNSRAFQERLQNVAFANGAPADFGDLAYLLKPAYEGYMRGLLGSAKPSSWSAALSAGAGVNLRVGYLRNEWSVIAQRFGLYVSNWPRGQFEHVTLVRTKGRTILFFDRLQSPLAPLGEGLAPAELHPEGGDQGKSCEAVCASKGKRCGDQWFDLVNNCKSLMAHFPCPRGCAYEVGPDIPVYVSDLNHSNGGVCLITDANPTCAASHPSTSRLCPCV